MRLAAWLVIWTCCLPLSVATAQDELPLPQRDESRDPAHKPRERVKERVQERQQNAAAKAPDPEKFNNALQILLEPLIEREAIIRSLHIELDPRETNLQEDRVTLAIDAELNPTDWTDEISEANLKLQVRVEPAGVLEDELGNRTYVPTRGVLESSLEAHTDVLGAVNYALPQIRRKLSGKVDLDPLAERILAKLETIDEVGSMDELADLFTYISAQQFLVTVERIDALRLQLAAAEDEQEQRRLKQQIHALRLERDRLLAIHPSVERNDRGEATSITVSALNTPAAEAVQVDRFLLVISAEGIAAETQGSLNRGMEIYALAKPMILNVVTIVQEGDRRQVETLLRTYLPLLQQLLLKEMAK